MDEYFLTRKNKKHQHLRALLAPEVCHHCKGSGLQPERLAITLGDNSMRDLKAMSLQKVEEWLINVQPKDAVDTELVAKLYAHLQHTLERAHQLHIDHLQLNRKSSTLSGGEQQRYR